MASPNFYSTGNGGSSGSTLATVSPVLSSGTTWYVSSTATGAADAASPAGRERIKPLLTLAQAITNASANDTICILANHTETLTSTQTISTNGLNIIGEGTGSNRPKFTRNIAANGVMWDVTGAGITIDNIYFPATATTASTGAKIKISNAVDRILNCYFEASTLDDGPQLETVTSAGQLTIYNTTFISTASGPSDQPDSAIKITNALTDLTLDTVVFSGGSSGWANPFAFNGAGAITRLRAINCDLLLDSDVTLATGTVGYWHTRNKSGSARVVWAA